MKFIIVFVLLFLWILTGCESRPDPYAAREKLMEADRQFSALSAREGAAEAFYHYMDSSAVQFTTGSGPVHGRENIYSRMKPSQGKYTLLWKPQFADVSSSGDMGWTWGTYVATTTADSSQSHGHYLNVWKKAPDGAWRVVADIGNVKGE